MVNSYIYIYTLAVTSFSKDELIPFSCGRLIISFVSYINMDVWNLCDSKIANPNFMPGTSLVFSMYI